MKTLISLLAFVPNLLLAETFTIDTNVSEVTVYPEGAEIVRTGTFSVAAGKHRLVLLGIPTSDFGTQFSTLQVQADSLRQSSISVRAEDVPWQDYESNEVKQAKDRVADIEDQIMAVHDEAETARLQAEAARQTITFLSNLGKNEGLAGSDTESLRNIARMVGDEALHAEESIQTAEIAARKIEERLVELQRQLEAAQADLAALIPETDERMFVAVDVIADADARGTLSVSYLDFYGAQWTPGYEYNLTTGESPEIRIDRRVLVVQQTGENWQDVTLNVSTFQPAGKNSATPLRPQRKSINNEITELEEPVFEAPVVFEETQSWRPNGKAVQGTGITYTLPEPISISSGSAIAEFELDSRTQTAEIFATATPRFDKTAYRTARFTNPFEQNLIASDLAKWLVDGTLVATGAAPEIGPREEIEMGFGPLYGLTVDRYTLNRSSGDTGLISRSNQNVERVQIRVENLTKQSWPLRLLDQVPYSEQDDLEISWSAQPRPTEENIDNKRGILAWEMEIAPGQSEIIQLDTSLSWPEGMVLD